MAFCPNCGKELSEGVKFCGSCGHKIEEAVDPEKKETINTEEIKEAATEALEKGKEVAGEALEKGKEVAGEALEKGKEVAGEALEKGKELVENVTEAAKNVDVNEILNQAKAGNKKVIAIAAAAVLVVVLLVVALFGGGGNYMDPVDAYMKAINNKETNYITLQSTLMGDSYGKDLQKVMQSYIDAEAEIWEDYSYEEMLEEQNESIEDFYDDVEDEYDSFKLSFEKKSAEKMDKDDLKDLAEDLDDYYKDYLEDIEDSLDDDDEIEEFADSYNIDEDEAIKILKAQRDMYKKLVDCKVNAGYEVKGTFVIKADGDTYETDTVKLYIVKINGDWVYVGSDDYISFEDVDDVSFYYIENMLNNGGFSNFF